MSRLDTSVAAAAEASWWDRAEVLADPWGDPLERVAIIGYELGYNTPEAVNGDLSTVKACEATAERWRKLPASTRHLLRRRAAIGFEVAQRKPSGAR